MARRTFLLLAIGVLVLSACGGGAGDGAEVTTPGVSAGSPVATGERVLVSGTTVCDFTSEITENEHGPVSTFTGTMACTDEASDPRVSGRDEFELTETEFVGGGEDIAWFRCENQTLTTEAGTWRGECYGSEFVDPGRPGLWTSGYSTLYGEGAYEGLVYHQLYAQSPDTEDHYVLAGWIEPAG